MIKNKMIPNLSVSASGNSRSFINSSQAIAISQGQTRTITINGSGFNPTPIITGFPVGYTHVVTSVTPTQLTIDVTAPNADSPITAIVIDDHTSWSNNTITLQTLAGITGLRVQAQSNWGYTNVGMYEFYDFPSGGTPRHSHAANASYGADKLFDNNLGTYWYTSASDMPVMLGKTYTTPVQIPSSIRMVNWNSASLLSIRNCLIQVSYDNGNSITAGSWTTVATIVNRSSTPGATTTHNIT